MLLFPNAKINIGLRVLYKREDGYHEIESIFFPIPWNDVIEIGTPVNIKETQWNQYGLPVSGKHSDNLIYKAYQLLKIDFQLPPIAIHLLKNIPMGAGMGGGSSDAAFMLKGLNDYFSLNLTIDELSHYAQKLGADCTYFLYNTAAMIRGFGEKITPISIVSPTQYIVVINPGIHISTVEAYQNIIPENKHQFSLEELITKNVTDWKNLIFNDFEKYAFTKYPTLQNIKELLYKQGALYASMTGSGSTIYGFFNDKVELNLPALFQKRWLTVK